MKKFFDVLVLFNIAALVLMTVIFSFVWILSYLDNITGDQMPVYMMFYELRGVFILLELVFICIGIYESKNK